MDALFHFLTQVVTSGASIIAIILLAVTFLIGLKMLSGGRGKKSADADQARQAQELYRAMDDLERRMENLETLLLDREGGLAPAKSGAPFRDTSDGDTP